MPSPIVASMAKSLLRRASRNLGVADPVSVVSRVLDESLSFRVGEQRGNPFAPSFAETVPESLGFQVAADGPGVTAADRVETSTRALQDVVGANFGPRALSWLDGKLEEVRGPDYRRSAHYGASFGSSFDRDGVTESYAQYEWGPTMIDTLPAPLLRTVRVVMQDLPALQPAFSTIRCGRSSGSQQVSFTLDRPLPLAALQPLMEHLGLGSRHASLMSALGFVLGARFTLPADSALLTLRPTHAGIELRLDVNLDALPDPPAHLIALMRLQMTERPKSLQGLDRWLMALTPDGYPGPGTVSVLSAWVRADHAARIAIYLRPALFDAEAAQRDGVARDVPAHGSALGIDSDLPEWSPIH